MKNLQALKAVISFLDKNSYFIPFDKIGIEVNKSGSAIYELYHENKEGKLEEFIEAKPYVYTKDVLDRLLEIGAQLGVVHAPQNLVLEPLQKEHTLAPFNALVYESNNSVADLYKYNLSTRFVTDLIANGSIAFSVVQKNNGSMILRARLLTIQPKS